MKSTRTRKLALGLALGGLASILPLVSHQAEAALSLFDFPCTSAGSITGDFNNDGRPDLAIGAPGDDLEQTEVDGSITKGVVDAGSISVVYSDSSGPNPLLQISSSTRKFFSQNTPGMIENAEKGDSFGIALAAGDFDGIGGDDLAIGVPGEGDDASGAIHILYSGALNATTADPFDTIGLSTGVPGSSQFNRVITEGSANLDGKAEPGDNFGYALAAGDINGDGLADLVIGAPKEDVGTVRDAGVIHVVYGTPHGLDPAGAPAGVLADQVFEQGPGQLKNPEVGRAEPSDFFGGSIAIGQFNNSAPLDIAVGAPGEDVRSVPDGGAVRVLYSRGATGISTVESDFFHQQTLNVADASESADRFGCALAAGDFDADGDDELAIGVPGEGVGTDTSAGIVQIIYNSGLLTGLSVDPGTTPPLGNSWIPDQVFSEDDGGVPGVAKPDDRMGASLAVANFDGAGPEDLAIGVPTETLFENKRAGSIRIMYGSAGFGITDDDGAAFAQSSSDLASSCPLFGILDECLIGPPDYSPTLMVEEEGDQFGASIAAADFDGNGFGDVAVGVPGEDLGLFVNWLTEEEVTIPDELLENFGIPVPLSVDEASDAGMVNMIYGPFPRPPTDPDDDQARMDVLYRQGNSPFGPLRNSFLHEFPFLENNQINPVPADPSFSRVLEGDNFGTDQS